MPESAKVSELLAAALAAHQQGRLAEAEAGYEKILSLVPRHPDALHLLGVLSHQRGEHRRAAELIRAAIAVAPEAAAFHANLAEALRASGEAEEAVGCCRAALHLQPAAPAAVNNLGLALLDLGRLEEAEQQFRAALELRPDFADAQNNLGNVLRQRGRLEQALEAYRLAAQLAPGLAEAHTNRGQLLLELGRAAEALGPSQEAVRLAPASAAAQNNLGNALRGLGRLPEAKQRYSAAIELAPDSAMAHNNLGLALEEEGAFDEARIWLAQALELDSQSAQIHTNMARVLLHQRDRQGAQRHLQQAVQLDPDCAEAQVEWSGLLREQQRLPEALQSADKAVRLSPHSAAAHLARGQCLLQLGRAEEAKTCFCETLQHDPLHAAALSALAAAAGADLPEAEADAAQRLIDKQLVSPRKQSELHYALANVRDLQQDFAAAEHHARLANQLRRQADDRGGRGYDADAHERFVERMIEAFDLSFFQAIPPGGLPTELPVFHVGLPRSGKSLAESLLSEHPDVHAAGELHLVRQSFDALPRQLRRTDDAIDCVPHWTSESICQTSQQHLDQLRALAPEASRIIDTMPHNYLYLGVVAALFPNARIVHCRRDLRDTALSCWLKNFKHLGWAADMELLAHRLEAYCRIMDHWRNVLSGRMLEISYEDMVGAPQAAAAHLAAFLGIAAPAGPTPAVACRPAAASQAGDASHPLTTKLIGRWRHYPELLGPVLRQFPDG